MTRGTIFWVLMLLWLIFGCVFFWPRGAGFGSYAPLGSNLLLFVLLGLLGWKVFGPAIKGD